jgi:hypothetical protein
VPRIYQRRQRIPELKGEVRGGLAIVVRDMRELGAIDRLVERSSALPGDPLKNLYRIVANAGSSLENWMDASMAFQDDGPHTLRAEVDLRIWTLRQSLKVAGDLWKAQRGDEDRLAAALIIPRPGRTARLDASRPAFVLDFGSIRARVLTAGGRLREFGVALFPVARSRRQANLVEALRDNAAGTRLPRLETIRQDDLSHKTGAVVFLHGLISTDVGTFDGFIDKLRAVPALGSSTLLVSWPHDTLDSISLNAEQLSEMIEQRLGASDCPIAFVCHSRGGLVARRTVVELLQIDQAKWQARLRGYVTFGTPHEGAELAESGDEMIGKLLLMKTMANQAGLIPLVDALYAVKGRKSLPGITDLRPRSNGGKFLRRLKRAESRLTKRPGSLPVALYAVGGNASAAGLTGVLSRRYFGGAANDLVVPSTSATPAAADVTAEARCDHFGYFSAAEMQTDAAAKAVDFVHALLFGDTKVSSARPDGRIPVGPPLKYKAKTGATASQ